MKNITFPIVIEADADGFFVSCPALQGCYSQGDTYEEAVENIKDAIKLHVVDRLADGEEIPQAPTPNHARNLFRTGKAGFLNRAPERQPHDLQECRGQTSHGSISCRESPPSQGP